MGNPVVGVSRQRPNHIHYIRHHGGSGRIGAGAGAVVQCRAYRVTIYQNRIHYSFHIGNEPSLGDQSRVHAQLDAVRGALGDAKMFDPLSKFLGKADVLNGDAAYPFCIYLVELEWDAERY